MVKKGIYSDTTNTAAGINTPKNHEDEAPTDPIAGAVGQMVDKLKDDFDGKDNSRKSTGSAETGRR